MKKLNKKLDFSGQQIFVGKWADFGAGVETLPEGW
jgi:hypothetical protein